MENLGEPGDWQLVGEGRAHAVFAYKGMVLRPESCLAGKVLRMAKVYDTPDSTDERSAAVEQQVWSCDRVPDPLFGLAYVNDDIRPLLGDELVPLMRAAAAPAGFVDALLAALSEHGDAGRPPPAALHPTGMLMDDHARFAAPLTAFLWELCCGAAPGTAPGGGARGQAGQQTLEGSTAGAPGPAGHQGAGPGSGGVAEAGHAREGCHYLGPEQDTLCVELKPKCGCLPTLAAIAPAHAIKRTVPRYSLHQRLKLAQGLIERASAYDPRDLFSGAPPRMAAALRALLADPQNNLRLFWRGGPVPPAPGGLAGAAGALPAVQALGGLDGLVDALVAVLHAEHVLERVLAVQRLDTLDAEGAHVLLQELLRRDADAAPCREDAAAATGVPREGSDMPLPDPVGAAAPGPPSSGGAAPPAALAGAPDPGPDPGPNADPDEAAHRAELARLRALPQADACAALRAYLTAATAKDCSVMVALQVLPSPDPATEGSALPEPAVPGAAGDFASGHALHEGSAGSGPMSAAPGLPAPAGNLAERGAPDAPPVTPEPETGGSGRLCDPPCGADAPPLVLVRQTDASLGGVIEVAGPGGRRLRLRYKVAVADLDAKRLAKVEEHWRLDQAIMQAVTSAAAAGSEKLDES